MGFDAAIGLAWNEIRYNNDAERCLYWLDRASEFLFDPNNYKNLARFDVGKLTCGITVAADVMNLFMGEALQSLKGMKLFNIIKGI